MHPILAAVRDNLGDPPRRFRRAEWPDLVIPEPAWVKDDDLAVVFRDQRFLYEEGEVVWGAFVQANMLLSRPGPGNHPGTVVYSRHRDLLDDPEQLLRFARRLGRLKQEESDDPAERRYGAMLRDEMERAMRWRAPERLTDGLPVYSTSVMVCRRHVPGRLLVRTHVPLLRHRDTVATLIVPYWFWPRGFRERWAREAADMAAECPQWVTVTPAAAAKARELAAQEGLPDGWCVRLSIDRAAEGTRQDIKLALDPKWDEFDERVFRVAGIRVSMPETQAEELRGAEIDFVDDGRRKGFIVD